VRETVFDGLDSLLAAITVGDALAMALVVRPEMAEASLRQQPAGIVGSQTGPDTVVDPHSVQQLRQYWGQRPAEAQGRRDLEDICCAARQHWRSGFEVRWLLQESQRQGKRCRQAVVVEHAVPMGLLGAHCQELVVVYKKTGGQEEKQQRETGWQGEKTMRPVGLSSHRRVGLETELVSHR
jgi:hypothetical protein